MKIRIFTKIHDFRENPKFSRKSQIFANIQNFRENLGFSRKSRIFVKMFIHLENTEDRLGGFGLRARLGRSQALLLA